MDAERCPVCDRVKATWWDGRDDLCHRDIPAGAKGVCTLDVCLRDIEWCESHAVDWHARALAAEGRLRTLDRIRALGNGQVPAVVAGAWEVLHDD